jgi:hypothetical protein
MPRSRCLSALKCMSALKCITCQIAILEPPPSTPIFAETRHVPVASLFIYDRARRRKGRSRGGFCRSIVSRWDKFWAFDWNSLSVAAVRTEESRSSGRQTKRSSNLPGSNKGFLIVPDDDLPAFCSARVECGDAVDASISDLGKVQYIGSRKTDETDIGRAGTLLN